MVAERGHARDVGVPVVMQRQVPPEEVQERTVEETGVPISRVVQETIQVEKLKSQRFTLLADKKQASKLNGGCAAQAPEWEEPQGLRDEELVTTRDINKLMNDYDELIPKWLNSVKDVVDSEDISLNIYREILQQNKVFRVIKMNLAKKYLEMLAIAGKKDDDYKFFEQFGKRLKFGIHESFIDGVEIAELLKFNTSKPGDEQISFKVYVDRMKEGQDDICYITDESIAVAFLSSFGEFLHEKGYEVLYMADPVGEFSVHQPKDFVGTKLNDNDDLELSKEILPGPSLMQVQSDKRGVACRARAVVRDSSGSSGMNLISMAIGSGRAEDEFTSLSTDIKSHASAIAGPTDQLTGTGERLTSVSVSQHRSIQSTLQQHRNYHIKQAMQRREGNGEKGQEERERGRKGEGERGQAGRKEEEEKEAVGERSKQVEKDVMDWTVVRRNKVAQIFVKVNGSKATPMEVNLTDGEVEDVVSQIQKDEDVYVAMHGKSAEKKREAEEFWSQ